MSGITAGVGLFSGIDTATLIEQLLQIEARPKVIAQQRIISLQQQQAAYLDLNSSLLALETAAGAFNTSSLFDQAAATSSDETVLTATAGTRATPGSYTFLVDRLVTTQQQLSRGFADSDVSGLGATEFTFESPGGGVRTETSLAELNGGLGVSRGTIVITESGGGTATVDLSRAVTIDDVIGQINAAAGIDVTAAITGDGLTLTQGSGLSFSISSGFGDQTAEDLGIAGTSADASGVQTIAGAQLRTLSGGTALSLLNDGIGVQARDKTTSVDSSFDFTITARDGTSIGIKLSEITETTEVDGETITETIQTRATTVQDVIDIINETAAGAVTASIGPDGVGITLTDNTGGTSDFIVESAAGRSTAEDLGIATAGEASATITGRRLIAGLNSTLVTRLSGGAGITGTEVTLTDRAGVATTVTLTAAALDGSLTDVIRKLNTDLEAAGVGITVGLNRAGNGIALTDTSGGTGDLIVGGDAAASLGIETAGTAASTLNGANLQHQWIGRATAVDDLNDGDGIGTGRIRITDATGTSAIINIGSAQRTVGDLIAQINAATGIQVSASINDTGDGIVIVDDSGTAGGTLRIEDVEGEVAQALNIDGEFEEADGTIQADGSYEFRVSLDELDTLDEVAQAINEFDVGVRATVINDGSAANPYRLSLTAIESGSAGRVIVDTGDIDLGLTTLSRGEDAVVFFGAADPADAILLTSSDNTLDAVVPGVTIDLTSTSDEPVELVVTRDTAAAEQGINDFVDAFNSVLSTIDRYVFYDVENNRRGVLLGDTTTNNIKQSLFRIVQGAPEGVDGAYQFLFQAGVKIGSGAQLEFDREVFRAALEDDPRNIEDLFAANQLLPNEPIEIAPGVTVQDTQDDYAARGVAELIKQFTVDMTNSIDGLLTNRSSTIDSQIELQEDRIAAIDEQLENKRLKLSREFVAMEQAIAQLQTQQSALAGIGLGG